MPAVAIAAIGAGVSVYSASKQSSAIKSAANQQSQSASEALALQREARDEARGILTPYADEGRSARMRYNALLGLGGSPAMEAGTVGGAADYGSYVRSNPEIMAAYEAQSQARGPRGATLPASVAAAVNGALGRETGGLSIEDFGRQYYDTTGKGAGHQLPTMGGSHRAPTPAISADQAREDAMAEFRKSPFYTLTRDSGRIGRDAIMSSSAASGRGIVSGKAARAVADWTSENEGGALAKYMASLAGVADQGFTADSGIASGGTNFAQTASNTLTQAAQSQANATIAASEAKSRGISDALGFAGWGIGQLPGQTNTPTTDPAHPWRLPGSSSNATSSGISRLVL